MLQSLVTDKGVSSGENRSFVCLIFEGLLSSLKLLYFWVRVKGREQSNSVLFDPPLWLYKHF